MPATVWFCLGVFWLSFACRETWQKWLLSHTKNKWGVSLLISGEALVCGLLLLTFSLRNGVPSLADGFWWFVLVTAILNPILFFFGTKAKQQADLSTVEPILVGGSATFVFVTERFTSVILGKHHETISLAGCAGLAVMGVGVYIALLKPGLDFWEPLRAILKQKSVAVAFAIGFCLALAENRIGAVNAVATSIAGAAMILVVVGFAFSIWRGSADKQELGIRYAFLGAFLGSWSSIFDKHSVMASSDGTFPAAIVMLAVGVVHALRAYKKNEYADHALKSIILPSVGLGIIMALVIGSYWLSLHLGQITYISPLKRVSLLFTLPMAFLLLRERTNMKRRFTGGLIVLSGTLLLAFG